jgi:serine/threonine-protein kinase RsbW
LGTGYPGIPDSNMTAARTHTNTLSRSYPAVAETVPAARRAVVEFAREVGLSAEQLDGLALAASEAITNAVLHAYSGSEGMVDVSAAVAANELWLLIGDDGHGLERGSDTPGLGMGLALIASMSDYFAVVKRSSGGTELRMQFRFSADGHSAPRNGHARGSVASATSAA